MQILVADDELTSRVMVETALREHGHTVRNCDDGFEAAKILSSPHAPRVAIISNTLHRLRGLDVCRFLCATGKKTGVYVILVTDVIDMELVELCRRAGVDDIVLRNISAASLHYRLDAATRVVDLETEIRRIQGVLQGLAAFESPLDKKARALRDANAALLESAKKKGEPAAGEEKKPDAAAYRGMPAMTDRPRAQEPAQGIRNLLTPETDPVSKNKPINFDDVLYRTPAEKKKAYVPLAGEGAPAGKAQEPAGDMSPEEIANAVAASSSAAAQTHEEAHQTALAGAEQLQNQELANEELIHPFEFDDLILNVFSGMGVTLKPELPPKPVPEGPVFISWVGVLIPSVPSWLDVLLVSGDAGARAVTAELLGQPKVGDSDIIEMFAELQNMVQGALRRYLEENGHKSVLQLSIPKAVRFEKLPELPAELQPIVESGFSFGSEGICARMFEHREGVTSKSVSDLVNYDLICDAVQKSGSGDKLLIPGTIVRAKEKELVSGITEVRAFRLLHVSPLVQALGADQLLGQGR